MLVDVSVLTLMFVAVPDWTLLLVLTLVDVAVVL